MPLTPPQLTTATYTEFDIDMGRPFLGVKYVLLPIEIIRLLKKKRRNPDFSRRKINEFDIYKFDPFELPSLSKSKSDQQVWNFFCEPYKNRNRINRVTKTGTWKSTCRVGDVKDENGALVKGCQRRTLVFYKRGFPSKQGKTDWFMYEFYVKDCPRYKKDFVFCYIKKNPNSKSNVSTPDDGQPSHSLASDSETHVTEKTSTEVESRQSSGHHLTVSDSGKHNTEQNLLVESRLQLYHNLDSDLRKYFPKSTSTMVEPRLLQLNDNLVFDFGNYFSESASTMVEPQLLQLNDNLVSDLGNHFLENTFTMVEPQLLSSDDNVVSDPGNHFPSNTFSMVKPQLPSNHNLVSDPGNHCASNTYSMVDPQGLPELLAESDAVHGCYWLNHGSVSAPHLPINPEQGPYYSYSNGFIHHGTVWSSQFDAPWKIQDEHSCEVTGHTLRADTDTDTINALIDELFVDIPTIACANHN